MSQSSVGNGGPDFELAEEILAVMPTDPFDQLDLARKITSMAIASRVSKLESDVARSKQKLHDKDRIIYELEEKVIHLDRSYHGADSRLKIVLDENMRLSKERDSLSVTVKKLSRDLAKPAETVDIGTCDQSNSNSYSSKDANGYSGSANIGNMDEASRHATQRFSITPYITPRLTPTGTPKIISQNGSPRGYSAAGSPQKTSGATTPTKTQYALSMWYPSSQQSSAANSPPRGRPLPGRTRIDGKEFFRQARTRLSYEQFSAFLANIKELNAQKQTREETLTKAEEIFGTDNKDLYLSFQGLLNRNVN
ncbi:hypothetical protein BT93_F3389 [Corymbia citriodora subsp. variegata]|nr:hypothetical protein BT93_F3389 [Corymbia citriodora subsp. variegata]